MPQQSDGAIRYQALAYALATDLPEATVFYADGGQDRDHVIPAVDKVVRIRHLDLTQAPDQVLHQIEREGRALALPWIRLSLGDLGS